MDHKLAMQIRDGLQSSPKTLPTSGLYDPEGSRLFQRICQLPEYPLYRAESHILHQHAASIIADLPERFLLIEPGCGDGSKISYLIREILLSNRDFEYILCDIDPVVMATAKAMLDKSFGAKCNIQTLCLPFEDIYTHISDIDEPILLPMLGSTIGNFGLNGAYNELRKIRACLKPGDSVLLGFALTRLLSLYKSAYRDEGGVTATFNLNYLKRINLELGGTFDLSAFRHYAWHNVETQTMHSSLMSLKKQSVQIEQINATISFQKGERIHTESSTQYEVSQMQDLTRQSGFAPKLHICDSQGIFCDMLLTAT